MRFEENRDGDRVGTCDQCWRSVYREGSSDVACDCGAIYNAFGQRLRDDLYSRPNASEWDDEIGDLEGYERAMSREEEW